MSQNATTSSRELKMPEPQADKEVLRVSIFDFAGSMNAQLSPLFPYLDPGAIVPCGAIFKGMPGVAGGVGNFQHYNSVTEIALCFGAKNAQMRTGMARVGPNQHAVGSLLVNPEDEASYCVLTVTQRQSESGPQNEAFILFCEKCNEEIFRYDYDVTLRSDEDRASAPSPVFPTIVEGMNGVRKYNSDPENRRCKACGHENPRFPGEHWGREYAVQKEAAAWGFETLAAEGRA